MISTRTSAIAFRRALRQRDAENARLRARLTTAELAATSPHLGDLANFVAQVHGLLAGVLTTDAQGALKWANARFLARCGWALPALVGQPITNLLGTTPLEEATRALVAAGLAGGTAFEFDLPDPCPGHTGQWLRVRMHPLYQPARDERHFVALLEDITKQKKAQLALTESEQRYRELAEHVPGVLYRWRKNADNSLTAIYASPQVEEIFGLSALESERFIEFMHPDDLPRWHASVARALAPGNTEHWTFEGRVLVPGQPLRWWRGNSALSYEDEDGAVYSGIIQNITPMRQAEEALRRRALSGLLAVEGLGDGSWEYNVQTRQFSISAEYRAMLGYTEHECAEDWSGWEEFVHPDDSHLLSQAWVAYKQGNKPSFTCEHRLVCRDGSFKWVLCRALVTKYDAAGQPLMLTGITTDISANRKAQSEMAAASLRLATTIAILQRGILLVDENHRIVLTNDYFCQLFGLTLTAKELIGLNEKEIAQQAKHNFEDEDEFLAFAARTSQRRVEVANHLVTLRNGRVIQRSFVPVRNGDLDIGYLWKFEDITERHQAERELKRQEEKYRNIMENMQLGLMEADLDHQLVYANQTYYQMLGYTPAELRSQPLHRLVLPPHELLTLDKKLAAIRQGIASSFELEIITKQGERKWHFVGAAPMFGESKLQTGVLYVTLDITHQKELEQNLRVAKQQAEHLAQAKGLFLANMSHEIRTPMNAILGMSQLLAKTTLAPQQSNYLHAITTSAQNLLVIIDDILDLSKLNAGKMTIEQVGFSVARVCEQVEKTLLYKAEEKGLRFCTKVNYQIPEVLLGDPYRITQVLLNLASNAVKFTDKGQVTVECGVAGYFDRQVIIEFSVSDTGVGIDPGYLEHIFQEFSQEDISITRKFGGTGLGLSISRSLVELMGYELTIESEKNLGTTCHFCLCLPLGTVHDLPKRKALASASRQELHGKRVLLVEDNAYNRLLANTLLSNAHIQVTEAENGREAIARVREQVFDLILMDVQMPVLDGLEATQLLRQELALTTPIIALTAAAISGEKQKCLAAGMNDYLTKPFYEDELLQLIYDWIFGPLSGSAVALPPPAAPPASTSPALYQLDGLLKIAGDNQQFVVTMLQTFLSSATAALGDLHQALEASNLAGLQATAHRLRPSLVHLQVQPVVALMDRLEQWESPFTYEEVQPVVETTSRLLRQVLADLRTEIEVRRANLAATCSEGPAPGASSLP